MKKTRLTIILALLVVFTLGAVSSFAVSQNVKIIIDGKELIIPAGEPKAYINKDNRTVVPVRFIAEALGIEVDWNNDLRLVTFTDANTKVELKIGENKATVNNKVVQFDTMAVITQNRTFVPLRFISESFNAKVEWIESTWTVKITTGDGSVAEENIIELEGLLGRTERLKEIKVNPSDLSINRFDVIHDTQIVVYTNKIMGFTLTVDGKEVPPIGNANGTRYWVEGNEYVYLFNAERVQNLDFRNADKFMFRFNADGDENIYTIANPFK